jgi:catechol 2,3-dioxygenase-like lactoylglutathione lyase family enzyme
MPELKLRGIPIFRIDDVLKAKSFYADYLGFTVDWEHYYEEGAPIYMQISRAGLVLQLSENSRFKTGNIIYVETVGIEEYNIDLHRNSSAWVTPTISLSPWNTKQMETEDPFGNLLRFNEEAL